MGNQIQKADFTNSSWGLSLTGLFVLFSFCSFAAFSHAGPCTYSLPGDLNNDCKVDISDISIFASNWLVDCNQPPLDPACVDNFVEAQKAQFHAIEVGLELFKAEFGAYPESNDNSVDTPSSPENPNDNTPYCGANKLAEAMVGLDLLGFHPLSDFRADGLNDVLLNDGAYGTVQIYSADLDTYNWETAEENIQARKGPFVDLEMANAYEMWHVFAYYPPDPFEFSSLVLCDVFEKQRDSGKKTGMPILYFRARTQYIEQDYTNGVEDDIYYYPDNEALVELGSAESGVVHPLADGVEDWQDFENMILNPYITVIKRPWHADTFILISAGYDGLYGTSDDVFNFGD